MVLPAPYQTFFWDYQPGVLRWPDHRDVIIQRLLSRGDLPSWQWLREQLGDAELRAWIVGREGQGLEPKLLRFWELILEIPDNLVNPWVTRGRLSEWGTR